MTDELTEVDMDPTPPSRWGFVGSLLGILVGGLTWLVIAGLVIGEWWMWAPPLVVGAGLGWGATRAVDPDPADQAHAVGVRGRRRAARAVAAERGGRRRGWGLAMIDRPEKELLLEAIARFLDGEVRPAAPADKDPRLAFRLLIATH